MDDQTEISSTTPSYGFQDEDREANSLMDEAVDFLSREAEAHVADDDDILDLAGGAKDAIERHKSTLPRTEEPLLDFNEPEPSSLPISDHPEPKAVKPEPISSFDEETTKQTKVEEKEDKTSVTPSKPKTSSSSLCKYCI